MCAPGSAAGASLASLERLHQACERAPFSLVLSDVQMPHMDGYTLLEKVRDASGMGALGFILLTSSGQGGNRGRKLGAAACLTKPVRQSELRAAILESLQTGGTRTVIPVHKSHSPGNELQHIALAFLQFRRQQSFQIPQMVLFGAYRSAVHGRSVNRSGGRMQAWNIRFGFRDMRKTFRRGTAKGICTYPTSLCEHRHLARLSTLGVDLICYGSQSQFEYDLQVAPGGRRQPYRNRVEWRRIGAAERPWRLGPEDGTGRYRSEATTRLSGNRWAPRHRVRGVSMVHVAASAPPLRPHAPDRFPDPSNAARSRPPPAASLLSEKKGHKLSSAVIEYVRNLRSAEPA